MRGGGAGGAPFVSPPLRRWYAPRKTKWLQVRCAATAGLKKLAPSWQQQYDVENVDDYEYFMLKTTETCDCRMQRRVRPDSTSESYERGSCHVYAG